MQDLECSFRIWGKEEEILFHFNVKCTCFMVCYSYLRLTVVRLCCFCVSRFSFLAFSLSDRTDRSRTDSARPFMIAPHKLLRSMVLLSDYTLLETAASRQKN